MVPTTDQMDHITPEERKDLMAFCETDQSWWAFIDEGQEVTCPSCGDKPSQQIGFQIMTKRTFDPVLHGKKKVKRIGGKLLR